VALLLGDCVKEINNGNDEDELMADTVTRYQLKTYQNANEQAIVVGIIKNNGSIRKATAVDAMMGMTIDATI
jgi:hypothetical protein